MRDFHAWPGTTGLRILHSPFDLLPSSSQGRFAASQAVWGRYGGGQMNEEGRRQIANRHYDEFEAAYPEAYEPPYGVLRRIIPEVVHKFLECGNLERGFARIRCDHCEHEYLLAFSCKSRWFCPSCHHS
jgi:hypothetical protein